MIKIPIELTVELRSEDGTTTEAIAIITCQDGSVRPVKSKDGRITCWDQLGMSILDVWADQAGAPRGQPRTCSSGAQRAG